MTNSFEDLQAYENRALQKFEDFTSLVEIIANTKIDTFLREQTHEQVLVLFENNYSNNVKYLIDSIVSINNNELSISLINYNISQHLSQIDNGNYEGLISFEAELSGEDKSSFCGNISFTLLEVEKDFGNEQEIVWEVLLGEINILD